MWLSKNIAKIENKNSSASSGKIKQSADRRISASAANGTGQFALAAPPGMIFIPQKDDEAVVIPTDSGQMCIGVRIPPTEYELEAGEIALYSAGGATIFLKNNGKVIINGEEY